MLSKGEMVLIKKFKSELEERKKINGDYLELYDEFKDRELKMKPMLINILLFGRNQNISKF